MAKKSELEQAHEECERIHREIASALHSRDITLAVKLAVSALSYQHASVTFQRRFQNLVTIKIPAVDTILRYAPTFFLSRSIDAVETWYNSGNKAERTALSEIPVQITSARDLTSYAVKLWEVFADSPEAFLRPPNDPRNKAIIPIWVYASVVTINPNAPTTYIRVTDPRRDAVAKCSSCGRERRAPITELLEPSRCPACERRSVFVIIRRVI